MGEVTHKYNYWQIKNYNNKSIQINICTGHLVAIETHKKPRQTRNGNLLFFLSHILRYMYVPIHSCEWVNKPLWQLGKCVPTIWVSLSLLIKTWLLVLLVCILPEIYDIPVKTLPEKSISYKQNINWKRNKSDTKFVTLQRPPPRYLLWY